MVWWVLPNPSKIEDPTEGWATTLFIGRGGFETRPYNDHDRPRNDKKGRSMERPYNIRDKPRYYFILAFLVLDVLGFTSWATARFLPTNPFTRNQDGVR